MSSQTERLNAALIGRYRIERELGAGGMATVYRAEDLKHDRKVAIKVLKPELAAVLGAERFVVEIKTTAAMSHPHILPLFDSGTADGFLFYVMPYIEGETIREKLNRETQFGVDEAVRIAREIADALDYAHRHGVVHRDIKPENILLHDGRAMVMDFGIALAVSAAAGGRMTETGLSLGTPHYMSPEQATAEKEITARSDEYSLASVLYEMLAGQPPHVGGAAQQIIMRIITEPARPVNEFRKNVPMNVVSALAKALEKLPADRFESVKAFGDALREPHFTHGVTSTGSMAAAPRSAARFIPWVIAAGALVVAATFAMRGRAVTDARVTASVIPLELRNPSDVPPNEIGSPIAISPDGNMIVYVGPDPEVRGTTALWRRPLDRLEATPIAGTRGSQRPRFSDDGKSVYFVVRAPGRNSNANRVVPIEGGLAQNAPFVAEAMLPLRDGGTVYLDSRQLHRLKPGELPPQPRAPGDSGAAPNRILQTRAGFDESPDGRRAVLGTPLGQRDSIRIGAFGEQLGFLALGTSPRFVDDRTVTFRGQDGSLMVGRLDDARRAFASPPIAVAPGIATAGSGAAVYAVAGDGTLIYVTGGAGSASRLTWVRPDGKEDAITGAESRVHGGVALAPDGRRAVSTVGALATTGDLWLEDLVSGARSPLTTDNRSTRPAWSHDGKSVTFVTANASTAGLSLAGRVLTKIIGNDAAPDSVAGPWPAGPMGEIQWSPDGRSAAIRVTRAGRGADRDVFVRAPGATAFVPFAADSGQQERGPRFSPDGKWLLYVSDKSGRDEVYVSAFPSGGERVPISVDGGREATWSRDGTKIFYRGLDGWMTAATVSRGAALQVTKRERLFDAVGYLANQFLSMYDVAPDGRFLMLKLDAQAVRTDVIVIRNWAQQVRARLGAEK